MDIPIKFVYDDYYEEEDVSKRQYLKLVNNGRKRKAERKISCYKDKRGLIKKEHSDACCWFTELCNNKAIPFDKIKKEYMRKLMEGKCKSRKRFIRKDAYYTARISSIIIKNRYIMYKKKRIDELVYFYDKDIYEFITLLYVAYNNGMFEEFTDIPDVSYILRQIKKTGIGIYMKKFV